MATLPDKHRETLNLVRDAKGRVLFEAKAWGSGNKNITLTVYAFAPATSARTGSPYARPVRYVVLRETFPDYTDRAALKQTLRTMCDLAAIQLGGVEYALREAIR